MKFKVGDRVVPVVRVYAMHKKGKILVITQIIADLFKCKKPNGKVEGYYEAEQLEFEHIYNPPLYKALT
jgi:hypothetical protein